MTRPPAGFPSRRLALTGLAGSAALGAAGCTGAPETTAAGPSTTPAPVSASAATLTPTPTPSPTGPPAVATTPGPDLTQATTGRAEVALTFHGAGDPAIAESVLAILAEHTAFMTVFAIGQWVQANPELIRTIAAAGHELGNHTWSHPDLPTMEEAAVRDEIRRGREALATVLGEPGWWFRPSATQTSTETIRRRRARRGMPCASPTAWTLRTSATQAPPWSGHARRLPSSRGRSSPSTSDTRGQWRRSPAFSRIWPRSPWRR